MDSNASQQNRPKRPRASLRSYGVHTASVNVDYDGTTSLSTDGFYSHGTLALQDSAHKQILRLTFQRHRFALGTARNLMLPQPRPDARFDYGTIPWSSFYGGYLDMRFTINQPQQLATITPLVTRLHSLLYSAAFSAHCWVPCELATHVKLLEWLSVPVTITHCLAGASYSDKEVRAQPERFGHLVATRYLDESSLAL